MVCIIIFGYRSFGKCDYFKLREAETDKYYYVRTQFFHISFVPLCPIKSYIGTDGQDFCVDKVLMLLPETSWRSIGWAWLRALMFVFCAIPLIVGAFTYLKHDDEYDEHGNVKHIAAWKIVVCLVVSAIFLAAGIALQFYKPKATEEKRQEYLQMILARVGRAMAEQGTDAVAPQNPVNVQAQAQPKRTGLSVRADEAPPAYGYDQAPIQNYNFPAVPSAPNQGAQNAQNAPNVV